MEEMKQAQDQLAKIGGGDGCSVTDIFGAIQNLTQAYEGLVDFTSHVIERVLTAKS